VCRSLIDDGTHDFLTARGIAVLNASPLSMGLLTKRGPPTWHPARPETRRACAAAAAYCEEQGVDISTLALAFCLEQPSIATTLVSTASLARMRHDVEVAQGAHPLSPHERAVLAEVQARFFSSAALSTPSWEGFEVAEYHAGVGKALLARWYARKAAARTAAAAGGESEAAAAAAAANAVEL